MTTKPTVRDHNVLIVGLPRTGKTTFLAAFWDVVSAAEVSAGLVLNGYGRDKEHLNEIRDLWANCQPIERTKTNKEHVVTIALKDVESGVAANLSFPDMYGESFEAQWTKRYWTVAYDGLAQDSVGAIVFVHPKKVKEPILIRDAQPRASRLAVNDPPEDGAAGDAPAGGEQAPSKLPPLDAAYAPTQVQLVELIQFLFRRKSSLAGFRLAVVVSAWDLVKGKTTPEKWVEERLPLLHQFVRANSDVVPYRIYGVSAQGGELKDAARLLANYSPATRIKVVDGSNESHDITLPVRWVMGASGS